MTSVVMSNFTQVRVLYFSCCFAAYLLVILVGWLALITCVNCGQMAGWIKITWNWDGLVKVTLGLHEVHSRN